MKTMFTLFAFAILFLSQVQAQPNIQSLEGDWVWYKSVCGWGYEFDTTTTETRKYYHFENFSAKDSSIYYQLSNADSLVASGTTSVKYNGYNFTIFTNLDTSSLNFYSGYSLNFGFQDTNIFTLYPFYIMDGCMDYYARMNQTVSVNEIAWSETFDYQMDDNLIKILSPEGITIHSYALFTLNGQLAQSGMITNNRIRVKQKHQILILQLNTNKGLVVKKITLFN